MSSFLGEGIYANTLSIGRFWLCFHFVKRTAGLIMFITTSGPPTELPPRTGDGFHCPLSRVGSAALLPKRAAEGRSNSGKP